MNARMTDYDHAVTASDDGTWYAKREVADRWRLPARRTISSIRARVSDADPVRGVTPSEALERMEDVRRW